MLWQENAVVHDCQSENSIFAIFDMQFLLDLAVFWQVRAVVHDFSLFKIFAGRKNRAQRQFLANGWQLKQVVHDFHQSADDKKFPNKISQANIRCLASDR